MPEQRLQRTRDAYRGLLMWKRKTSEQRERERLGHVIPVSELLVPSVAYRITQAQRAAEQQMGEQSLKDLQAYAGRSSREPL